MMMRGSRRRGLIAGLSIGAVVGVAVTDWPLGSLSTFWSGHAMLTNLVSSAVFAVITVTIIERWLRSQEERQNAVRRREEERRLTIVRLGQHVGDQISRTTRHGRATNDRDLDGGSTP